MVEEELEHRAGDFLYELGATLDKYPRAKFARFVIVREAPRKAYVLCFLLFLLYFSECFYTD